MTLATTHASAALESAANPEFREVYAGFYDDLYADKDYAAEVDVLDGLLRASEPAVRRILDLGCGTGGHAIPLALRGYDILGVDRAEHMLAAARRKAASAGLQSGVRWRQADVRNVRLDDIFDGALMMFAVLGYQTTDDDVRAALTTGRTHLRRHGILAFDVWFGPAVEHAPPCERVKTFVHRGRTYTRRTRPQTDRTSRVCTVNFELTDDDGNVIERETHRMRYFFPEELDRFLRASGFHLARMTAFPDLNLPVSRDSWNVLVSAQAV
ncbi:MAG: dTDP-3-amino-3,4,6-trideoxy-alpha-D-glucopyranose [Phycisphaerae bacterium]|nr:dTDP-3-amino-3,4,6-trideoxy-alpha-D-glucopyranose [Phycisphaerae bacterium]